MSGPWREDPRLRGRFHPDHPDDLQVLVHQGGPRIAAARPELMWVRVIGYSEEAFLGTVLNTPQQLTAVQEGESIVFLVPDGFEYPIRATEQYLAERRQWKIHACSVCGMSELFDPPSLLMAKVFPGTQGITMFTALCAICGGAQVVEKPTEAPSVEQPAATPWWRRWFSR